LTDIIISRRARNDFKVIWRHIAADNESAADKLLLAIDRKIERLRVAPKLGAVRDDIRPNVRMLVHGNYLVLYDYDEAKHAVTIVTVVHGARDLSMIKFANEAGDDGI
jgi:toxin ParE1/3/4